MKLRKFSSILICFSLVLPCFTHYSIKRVSAEDTEAITIDNLQDQSELETKESKLLEGSVETEVHSISITEDTNLGTPQVNFNDSTPEVLSQENNEPHQDEPEKIDGWVNNAQEWYYYENNEPKKGWLNLDSNWYYLHPDTGVRQTGWIFDQGHWYFLDPETSAKRTGWIFYKENWYYTDLNNGEMKTGWVFANNYWYYLDNDSGIMQTGWIRYKNNWYFLNSGGVMLTGWTFISGSWYYLDYSSGIMQTGWIGYKNNWYYLNSGGVMQTGWVRINDSWYYLDSSSGIMQTGWVTYYNNWYFLNSSGVMMTGWVFNNGNWYYTYPNNGIMQTGWFVYQNQQYYLHKDSGIMATGWFMDQSKRYYAYSSGVLAKNTTIDGFYLGHSGVWLPEIVNPYQTYTYEIMANDIALLEKNYPYLIKTEVIGTSVDGRNIYAVKVGNGQKEIFINGSHHAREHMTTNLIMEMMEQYAKSYADGTDYSGYNTTNLLNDVSIWFVPMVNPDGVSLVQKGHISANNPNYVLQLNNYSTDFSGWKANIRGVDLNRQYPADWENIKGNTGKPSSQNFKGYQPLSEPEAIALYQFTKSHNFKTAVAYHSSGEILYWYFKQNNNVYNRDYNLALGYGALTGYSLVSPTSNPSGGGYTDWFIQEMQQPGFTPEISPYTNGKPVPIGYFDRIWQQNKDAGLMLALDASFR